ncbi:metal-sensitive transcriptional regulator [Candidatus Gracilibacteria bacterium]|nr:metal-sensitive transcriptional regulator [Candidatus Gracilibacteria bacterium]
MKIKDAAAKKAVINRLRRIEGQIRGVTQMIEDEASVKDIAQQLAAIRSAMTHTVYEEFFCAMDKILDKKNGEVSEKDLLELRKLLKGIR